MAFASRRDGKVVTEDMSAPERSVVTTDRCYDLAERHCDRIVYHIRKTGIPARHHGWLVEK